VQRLTHELNRALDLVESYKKHEIIDAIGNRVSISDDELENTNLDDLEQIQRTVDLMRPTFHSSAPLSYETNGVATARQKLDSKHTDYMEKLKARSNR